MEEAVSLKIRLALGALGGALVAVAAKWLIERNDYLLWIAAGALIGFFFVPICAAALRWWMRDGDSLDAIESVAVAGITFRLASPQRKVAWQLFVEVMSRVATQPLARTSGDDLEALGSLYSLFTTTRTLLQGMPPTSSATGMTVELYAMDMLNRDLRPFLSKWHPALTRWENETKAAGAEWPLHENFRNELEATRLAIVARGKIFGELGGVQNLEQFFAA